MKKMIIFLIFCLLPLKSMAQDAAAAGDAPAATSSAGLPPKAKAFMIVCGYGTVGGALLGFASLAFGKKPRAIAQGASLGLYAGIIFGAYIVLSYEQPAFDQGPYYDDYGDDPFGMIRTFDGLMASTLASHENNLESVQDPLRFEMPILSFNF
jgi:hypothetical protein